MKLEPYELRDPSALIAEVARRVPLHEDTAYVVVVAHPSTAQRVVAIELLPVPAVLDGYHEARGEIRDVMRRLPIPDTYPVTHAVLTVVTRGGLCVFGPNECQWFLAWRYANHMRNCYDVGLILVTEHGWADFMTDFAASSPALVA